MDNDLKIKLGQMFMIGLDVTSINDEIIKLIKDYKIGGVVLYKKNYQDIVSMKNFINILKELNKDNIPLFIAVDQENGRVNRMPSDIHRIYNVRKQANTGDLNVINKCNLITANMLNSVGINMNFAPVLDINRNDNLSSDVIGDRSYGDNSNDVIKYGLPLIKTLKENNIVSVCKHFPGHGATNGDSHYVIPMIKDIKMMENEDLNVFNEAINCGCDAIMVGHLRIKGYGYKPATINKKIIYDYLINRYNYNGLIITDDLKMNTMKYTYGINNLVRNSINSYFDILMIKYKPGDTKKIYDKVYKMVLNGKIDSSRINESYNKIMNIKKNYHLSDDINDLSIDIDDLNKQIDDVNSMMN